MPKPKKLTQEDWIAEAWKRGELSWKLYPYQLPVYEAIQKALKNPEVLAFGMNISRRWGKTFIKLIVACEFAIQNPKSQIRFASETQLSIKDYVEPSMETILEDCPEELRPRYLVTRSRYIWPNGSVLTLAGTDMDHYKRLRGRNAHIGFVDEAGHCNNLKHIVNSILIPQLAKTRGTLIMGSTPPETGLDHDWAQIYQECEAEGNSISFTIYDDKGFTAADIERQAKKLGGIASTAFRREYLCEWVGEEDRTLIPEWNKVEHQYDPKQWEPDPYYSMYHRYVSMDTGFKDLTAILFAHYNFPKGTLFIEDEVTLKGKEVTTSSIAKAVVDKEKQLWWDPNDSQPLPVYRRVADNNDPIILNTIAKMHQLGFIPVSKKSLVGMLNQVRMWVLEGRIVIHPRCEKLLGCLQYGVWDKPRKEFGHSEAYGHYDHLAALVYLVLSIDEHHNPIPRLHGVSPYTHSIPGQLLQGPQNPQHRAWMDYFTIGKKKR